MVAFFLWLSLDEQAAILNQLRPTQPTKRGAFYERFDESAREYVAQWRDFHAAALACRSLAAAAAVILDSLRREVLCRHLDLCYTTAFMSGRLHWGRIHLALADFALHLSARDTLKPEHVQPARLLPSALSDEWRLLASTTHRVCTKYHEALRYEDDLGEVAADRASGMAELLLLWCLHFDRGGRSLTVAHRRHPWEEAEPFLPFYLQELTAVNRHGRRLRRVEPFESLSLLVRELAIAAPDLWGGFEIFWLTRGSPWLWPSDRLQDESPRAGWVLEGHSYLFRPTLGERRASGADATYKSAMQIEFGAIRERCRHRGHPEGPHERGYVYEKWRGGLRADASMQLVRALLRVDMDEAQQVIHLFLETDGAMPDRPDPALGSLMQPQFTDPDRERRQSQLAACAAMLACVLEAEDRLDDAARVLRYARDQTGQAANVLQFTHHGYFTERLYRMWRVTSPSPCARGTPAALERTELLQRFPVLGRVPDVDVPLTGRKSIGLPSIRPAWLLVGSLDRFVSGGQRLQPRPLKPALAQRFLRFDEHGLQLRRGSAAYYAHLAGPFLDVSLAEADARGGDLTQSSEPPLDLDDAVERWWRAGFLAVRHLLRGVRREADGEYSYHIMTQVREPCDMYGNPFNAEGDERRRRDHAWQEEVVSRMSEWERNSSFRFGGRLSPHRDMTMQDVCSFDVLSERSKWVSLSRLHAWNPTLPPDHAETHIALRWIAATAAGWQEGILCEVCGDTMTVALGQSAEAIEDLIRPTLELRSEARAAEAKAAAARAFAEAHAVAARERVMVAAARAAQAAWDAAMAAASSSDAAANCHVGMLPRARNAMVGLMPPATREAIDAALEARDAARKRAVAVFKPVVSAPESALSARQLAASAAKAASIAHTAAMETSRIATHGYGFDDEAWRTACVATAEACTAVNMRWPLCEWKISRKEARRLMDEVV